MNYIKKCPQCNGDMTYTTEKAKINAENKNALCRSCINRNNWKTRDKSKLIEMNKSRKGKKIEELYGEEKANEIKEKLSFATKGKTYEEIYGSFERANEEKEKRKDVYEAITINRKGKKLSDIYGEEKANEIKEKLSKNCSFIAYNKSKKGKTMIEIFGEEKTKLIIDKRKLSFATKGKTYEEIYGVEKANEMKELSSKRIKGKNFEEQYGIERANEMKEKISKSRKGKSWVEMFGEKEAEVRKLKLRQEIIEKLNNKGFVPFYNKNACRVFEHINNKTGFEGQHALNFGEFHIKELGYYVDYYEPNLNLIIEWDEVHHKKQVEKDLLRQKKIEDLLGCIFIRIDETMFDKSDVNYYDNVFEFIIKSIVENVMLKNQK